MSIFKSGLIQSCQNIRILTTVKEKLLAEQYLVLQGISDILSHQLNAFVPFVMSREFLLVMSREFLLVMSREFLLVMSTISEHFGTRISIAAAALWKIELLCSSKHLGAFFHELNPILMYVFSLFLSLNKFPFFVLHGAVCTPVISKNQSKAVLHAQFIHFVLSLTRIYMAKNTEHSYTSFLV